MPGALLGLRPARAGAHLASAPRPRGRDRGASQRVEGPEEPYGRRCHRVARPRRGTGAVSRATPRDGLPMGSSLGGVVLGGGATGTWSTAPSESVDDRPATEPFGRRARAQRRLLRLYMPLILAAADRPGLSSRRIGDGSWLCRAEFAAEPADVHPRWAADRGLTPRTTPVALSPDAETPTPSVSLRASRTRVSSA